jgi:ribosome-associated heat shock protein Hsp15
MDGVRMDKWLWAARFFKTRALAGDACEMGRIESNGLRAKPAREVRLGDMLRVRSEGGEFLIQVLLLSHIRGPAAVAQTMYAETDASREARLKAVAERQAMMQAGELGEGRPTKRNRRELDRVRGRIHRF